MGRARFLLLVVAIVVSFYGSKSCLEEEKRALLDIKDYMKFNNASVGSHLLPSWEKDPNSDCCRWERVTCDSYSGQVIHLSLHNVTSFDSSNYDYRYCGGYAYSLNMSLFLSLKHLKSLNLSYNCFKSLIEIQDLRSKSAFKMLETLDLTYASQLNQSIMEPMSTLTSLKNLILAHCSIDGPFPVRELSVLRNLELLDLSDNTITSPSIFQDKNSLSKLKKLRTLILNDNHFDNDIFKHLVALPALTSLFLRNNYYYEKDSTLQGLTGLLPVDDLCKMKQLQELDLSHNELTGSLHACLGNLTSLRALDLSDNALNGSIPASLFALLTSLKYLSLSNNKFEGLFSLYSLANNSKLKVLSLGGAYANMQVETENPPWIPSFQLEFLQMPYCQVNLPTRTIPSFLSYQRALRYIDISHNNLVGMFPNYLFMNNSRLETAELKDNSFTTTFQLPSNLNQSLDQLRHLILSNNKFQGKLLHNIGFFLPRLEYLDVSSNMFDGDIPASIGEMSNLNVLDLSKNNFSGKIPEQILLKCISLETLKLSKNNLQGRIFPTPMNLGSLRVLKMDDNKFNGTLEDGLPLVHLAILDISNNNLSGKLPSWAFKYPYNFLSVSSNNFEGVIPKDLCESRLSFVDLSNNRFFGALPSCLFTSDLHFLHLQGNRLNGTIPEILSSNSDLTTIDLRDNKLSGTIPESIYGLRYLTYLVLAGNMLEGQISSQICQLQHIDILDLSHNNFSGSIPSCFNYMSFGNNTSFIAVVDDLSTCDQSFADFYNYPHFFLEEENFKPFTDGEEVQIVTKGLYHSYKSQILEMMSELDLSSNQLTGEIPHQIGDLPKLFALNLSHNHLNGTIPESLYKLKQIESLDLSNNKLKGEIPPQMQDLNSLSTFNVCYNNLSGIAPNKGQFGTFDENSYKGNPYLSWSNSNRHIASPPSLRSPLNDTEKWESAIDSTSFCYSFVASSIMALLTLVIVLWINSHWRRAWFYYITICLQRSFGHFFEDAFF